MPVFANDAIVVVRPVAAGPADSLPDAADGRFRNRYLDWTASAPGIVATSLAPALGGGFGRVSSGFGYRSAPMAGASSRHAGIDLPGTAGTPVIASADGVVIRAGWAGGYGNLVEIRHGGGVVTRYGHLSAILVSALSEVRQGQEIGLMGSTGRSTGSHLHFEVRLDGQAIDPFAAFAGGAPMIVSRAPEDTSPRISAYARARGAVPVGPPASLADLRPTERPMVQLP